jgi:hypothetical protein
MPEYGIDPGDTEYLTPYPMVTQEDKEIAFDDILTYIREQGRFATNVTEMAAILAEITRYYAELVGV